MLPGSLSHDTLPLVGRQSEISARMMWHSFQSMMVEDLTSWLSTLDQRDVSSRDERRGVSTRLGNILAHNTQFFSDEFVPYRRQPSGDCRVHSRGHPRFAWMRTCPTGLRHRQRTKCLRGNSATLLERVSRGEMKSRDEYT